MPWIVPHALHPGAIQGKEGIKFCHLATMCLMRVSPWRWARGWWLRGGWGRSSCCRCGEIQILSVQSYRYDWRVVWMCSLHWNVEIFATVWNSITYRRESFTDSRHVEVNWALTIKMGDALMLTSWSSQFEDWSVPLLTSCPSYIPGDVIVKMMQFPVSTLLSVYFKSQVAFGVS